MQTPILGDQKVARALIKAVQEFNINSIIVLINFAKMLLKKFLWGSSYSP
jgi:hypothetical protein